MSAPINVSLVNTASAKAQQVTLSRDMTVADLQTLAPANVFFSVGGCTPSSSTTLGDLYDMCATQGVLEVKFNKPIRFGAGLCCPCGLGDTGSNNDGDASGSTGGLVDDNPGLIGGGAGNGSAAAVSDNGYLSGLLGS